MKFAFSRNALVPFTGCMAGDPFSPSFGAQQGQGMPTGMMPQGQAMAPGHGQQQQMSMPVASSVVPGMQSGMTANPSGTDGFSQTQQAEGGASPLDKYNKMFDNGNNKGGQQQQQGQQQSQQQQQQQQQNQQAQDQLFDLLNVGYGDFLKSGNEVRTSFTSGIDSAKVQSALSGNVEDFMAILQQVACNTFATASFGSSKLAGNYANQRFSNFEKSLDERFTKFDQARASRNINSMGAAKGVDFDSPALSGLRDMALNMFRQTYPEASREEIAKMAMDYLQDTAGYIAGKVTPGSEESGQQNSQQGQQDYDDLFGHRR